MRQLALYAVLTFTVTASAQQPATRAPDTQSQRAQNFASLWNPQVMIDRSVKQAVTRYKLTPEQEQIARQMTTEGVNAFLDKHEEQIRNLAREAIQARLSGTAPGATQVQDWAKRAAPLVQQGMEEILKGNRQFREHLTDEQKKVFDADQNVLHQQFDATQERLDNWMAGKFDPQTDWFNAPRPRPRPQTRPSQQMELDRWDLYVRGFINRYKLDASQAGQAMAILSESKNRATEYYYSRKTDIEAANARIKQVLADPSLKDQSTAAKKQLEDLNKPVDSLYAEMQQRLNQIPTESQRQAQEAEAEARRERWRNRVQRTGGDTALSATSQRQPATSQLADAASANTANARTPGVTSTRPARIRGPVATRPTTSAPTSQPGPLPVTGVQTVR